jgi:hypothetical protein
MDGTAKLIEDCPKDPIPPGFTLFSLGAACALPTFDGVPDLLVDQDVESRAAAQIPFSSRHKVITIFCSTNTVEDKISN